MKYLLAFLGLASLVVLPIAIMGFAIAKGLKKNASAWVRALIASAFCLALSFVLYPSAEPAKDDKPSAAPIEESTTDREEPQASEGEREDALELKPDSEVASEEESEGELEPEAESEDESEFSYIEDSSIREFFEEYNASSSSPMVDLEKGNIRSKWYAYTYGKYCQIQSIISGFEVTINGDFDSDPDNMRAAFHDVACVLDADVTDDAVQAAWDAFMDSNERIGDLTDNVHYAFFRADRWTRIEVVRSKERPDWW